MVTGVRRMNEVNARRARLVFGWGGICNQQTIGQRPRRDARLSWVAYYDRVPALAGVPALAAGVKAGMSPLSGGR